MPILGYFAFLIVACFIATAALRIVLHTLGLLAGILFHMAVGYVVLWVLNLILPETYRLALTPLNMLVVGLLGVPGVLIVFVIKYFHYFF